MDWGSDLEIASKKLIPRLGRRAGQNNTTEDAKSDDDLADSSVSFSAGKSTRPTVPVAPPRNRKTGWGDELKSGKAKTSNIIEQERFQETEKDEPEDDIPIIPDLDEIQEDNGLAVLPNVSSVGINRVAAYKELDKDLLKNEAFTILDDVNLSLLTDKLYPEKMMKETDEIWNWDFLFVQSGSGETGANRDSVETTVKKSVTQHATDIISRVPISMNN